MALIVVMSPGGLDEMAFVLRQQESKTYHDSACR